MTQSHTTGSDEQMSEQASAYNPWRVFIENVISGDNYFRTSEWHDLLEDLDRLYAIEASRQSPAAEEVVPQFVGRVFVDQLTGKRSIVPGGDIANVPDMARVYVLPNQPAADHEKNSHN
jgi:hypothetical protein